jgi:hypothetical protein
VLTPGTTKFPIQATSWTKVKGKRIQSDATLEEVKARTNRARMVMRPIQGDQNPQSSWMLVRPKVSKAAEAILGVSSARYDAHEGVNTALNGVYWVEVLSKEPNGLMVQNLSTIGRKKVKAVTKVVDPEFVYPMARGRDVKKWAAFPSCHIIIPTDENGTQLDTSRMRVKYAMTYEFFEEFFQDLVTRGGEPYKSKLEPYRRTEAKLEQSKAPPFYWIFNVSPSLAPYKVAWKEIAGKISGKGEFSVAVIPPFEDRWLGIKPIICDHKLMIIPLYDEKEAYYVAAILNSSIVRAAVKGYTIETTMDTHITKHIRVPGFDGENPLHLQLAELSESAHELARKNEVSKLAKVERQLDKLVARVYADTEAQH